MELEGLRAAPRKQIVVQETEGGRWGTARADAASVGESLGLGVRWGPPLLPHILPIPALAGPQVEPG